MWWRTLAVMGSVTCWPHVWDTELNSSSVFQSVVVFVYIYSMLSVLIDVMPPKSWNWLYSERAWGERSMFLIHFSSFMIPDWFGILRISDAEVSNNANWCGINQIVPTEWCKNYRFDTHLFGCLEECMNIWCHHQSWISVHLFIFLTLQLGNESRNAVTPFKMCYDPQSKQWPKQVEPWIIIYCTSLIAPCRRHGSRLFFALCIESHVVFGW